jgi:hypothetical protein
VASLERVGRRFFIDSDARKPTRPGANRGTIAKALREELVSVRLTDLTAADVQKALATTASRVSTRTVQIAHNVLVRAIRQAERDASGRWEQIWPQLHNQTPSPELASQTS